jgi:regulator of cell morphogenesis and NO signaling
MWLREGNVMNAIKDHISGSSWPQARDLVDYIESTYHGYLRLTLPVLRSVMEHIACERDVPPHHIDHLQRLCSALEDNLELHLIRQESRLFPKIRRIRKPAGELAWASQLDNSLQQLMEREERENRTAIDLVQQIETLLTQPVWISKGYYVEELRKDIGELDENLWRHVHLETEVLFPAVRDVIDGRPIAV